jgi:hypothetical protein
MNGTHSYNNIPL